MQCRVVVVYRWVRLFICLRVWVVSSLDSSARAGGASGLPAKITDPLAFHRGSPTTPRLGDPVDAHCCYPRKSCSPPPLVPSYDILTAF